ncbi:ABC transporter ATP-binding protein [Rhizobium sp. TRM95111]|uniref:ABC transporter ATP-binding protein n=1 Tax=Rhizobium alarense TaxID=2846851 RepID=UPI001F1C21ED|nr:ABC transporter ATP-binding protein [Rhizobium alarense]MCF3642009.1 ABC transporter ATP-binding protein [Rhizobium alarense]
MPLLTVSNLRTHFRTDDGGSVRAVEDVSFTLHSGETLAIVGESGSGKSVTSLSILRLLPSKRARNAGRIEFMGRDLLSLDERAMRHIRGNDIGMIFQEPMTSLNPVLTIGRQISETLRLHQGLSARAARERAIEMLRLVDLPAPEQRVDEYPHQLSGGMRQRVMIAIALACEPALLIADEPTTALDVTIQAQVLDLMRSLQQRTGTAIILITHDLGVVAETADRVIVMYAGRTVEETRTAEIFARPLHPYTRGLLATIPRLGSSLEDQAPERLQEIPGQVPSLRQPIAGCAFAERCSMASPRCRTEAPVFETKQPGHKVACHNVATGAPA